MNLLVKWVFLLNLLWICFEIRAQDSVRIVQHIYNTANHSKIERYQFDKRYEHLVLASGFSKEEVERLPFSDRRILKIDLVYSTFSELASFDQQQLDMSRMSKLVQINPNIVENKFFDWNVIGQTGCGSSAQCLDFFHGFVIYYEPYFTKKNTREEIDSIKLDLSRLQQKIMDHKNLLEVTYDRIPCEYPESYYSDEYLSERLDEMYDCVDKFKGRVYFDVKMDYHGRTQEVLVKGSLFPCKELLAKRLTKIFKWKRGLTIGNLQYDLVASGYISFPLNKESVHFTGFEIDKKLQEQYNMLQQYSKCVAYNTDTSFVEIIPKIKKKVVSEVIYRHSWEPQLIVADVTASMYPFTADLLKWVKLNTIEPTDFVFFNDGDDKPTEQKWVGSTGGLYHVFSSDYKKVRKAMFDAMAAGGGGDLPENNVEALLFGFNKSQPTKEVLMIADNYSYPRDEELFSKYQGTLRIILCHTEKGINTRYLDVARKYGFSVHTEKTDVRDLQRNELIIDGRTYRFREGKFRMIVKI